MDGGAGELVDLELSLTPAELEQLHEDVSEAA